MSNKSEIQMDAWVNPLRFFSLEGPPFRPDDAEQAYKGTAILMREIMGPKIAEGGKVILSPHLVAYLSKSGESQAH